MGPDVRINTKPLSHAEVIVLYKEATGLPLVSGGVTTLQAVT